MMFAKSLFSTIIFVFTIMTDYFPAIIEPVFPIPSGNSKQLFYLQRTLDINTIICELNYRDGILDKKNPVHVYWIKYNEQGQNQELSLIQKKFAYGIESRELAVNSYELNFKALKEIKMYLKQDEDKKFHVYLTLKSGEVMLNKIFLTFNGGTFWNPNIEHFEVTGINPLSREVVIEVLNI